MVCWLASKLWFKIDPAKQAAMKYKQKLMIMSGVIQILPTPNAIAASLLQTTNQGEVSKGTRGVKGCRTMPDFELTHKMMVHCEAMAAFI